MLKDEHPRSKPGPVVGQPPTVPHMISGLHVTPLSPNFCCFLTSYAAGLHHFSGPLSLHSSPGTAWTRFPQVIPSTAPSCMGVLHGLWWPCKHHRNLEKRL